MTSAALAVIPARGGSKRIPRKNVASFRGRPLLERTIEIAIASGAFDRIIVSTDDDEVMEVARAAGAEVPFRRPDELSGDLTATGPVIEHALSSLGPAQDTVCVLYPAAVFTTPTDISASLTTLLSDPTLRFVATASTFAAPVQRALGLDEAGHASMVWPEHLLTRSQDLPERYHDAGQLYWGRSDAWARGERVFDAATGLHVIPRWRVQDIDTPEDWTRAELLHAQLESLGLLSRSPGRS